MGHKRILTVLAILALAAPLALAQTVIDNFEDGDFTSNPTWTPVENAGGTQTVVSTQAYNGLNAVELTTDGAADNQFNRLETPLDAAYVYDGSKYVTARMSSAQQTGAVRAVNVFTSTSDTMQIGIAQNGSLYTDVPSAATSYAQLAEAGEWYNFKFLPNEGTSAVTLQITNQQGTVLHEQNGTFTGTISNIQLMTQDTSASTQTYYDYLTYNETPLQDFQFRMTSTSTTASNGSDSLYFSLSDMQYPFGKASDGTNTGYFSLSSGTVSTTTFEITNVQFDSLVYPNENNQPNKAQVDVNYTVVSSEGFSGVSNTVTLDNGAVQRTGSCSFTSVGPESRAYTCTVEMEYFDPADTYDLEIQYTANAESISYFNADAVTYGELVASQRIGDTLSFNNAGPGKQNVRSDQQISLKNTGNAALNITLTAYDLQARNDPTNVLDAENFKSGNASVSTAVTLAHSSQVQVTTNLAAGNTEALWFWLSMPSDLPASDYYSPNSWQIQGAVGVTT